jgi:transcriptional regulator with XRE-family HTH domain
MRVRCHLREIREQLPRKPDGGKVSLRDIAEQSGVSAGTLSQLERGVMLPLDRQIGPLEIAYGQTIDTWYHPTALLAMQADPEDE